MTTSCTPSTSTTTTTATSTSATSSSSPARSPIPNTFLYNDGPITVASPTSNWNRRQTYTVTGWTSRRAADRARHRPPLPAVQHRPPVHAQLRRPWPARPSTRSARRHPRSSPASGPKASTSTSVRSSTSATSDPSKQDHTTFGLAETGHRQDGRRQLHRRRERPLASPSRSRSAQLTATGQFPTGPTDPARPSACGPRPAGRRPGSSSPAPGTRRRLRPVRAGLPPGQPAGQRGPHPHGQEGHLERRAALRRQPVRSATWPTRSWPASSPCCIPGVFPNLAAFNATHGSTGPTSLAILLTGIPSGVVARIPELHRNDQGRHVAAQHGLPADHRQPVQPGPDRWRPGRLSRTDGGSSTTWPPSSSGRWPGPRLHLVDPSFKPGRRRRRHQHGPDVGAERPHRHGHRELPAHFPYLGTPHSGYFAPSITE